MTTTTSKVLSFGGGVNSVALAILLINEGWRGHILFADTGTEWPDTYCYMNTFESEWLTPRGHKIVRLDAKWRTRGYALPLLDYCEATGHQPLAHPRWCTKHYKVKPLHKYMQSLGIEPETELIGIAADEAWRMPSRLRPLVDRTIDRPGCVDIIQAEQLEVPRKSGCVICPFQRNAQWRELWKRYPQLFTRAEALERQITAKRGRMSALDVNGKVTLAQRRLAYESQMELFDDEDFLEYRPCMCQL